MQSKLPYGEMSTFQHTQSKTEHEMIILIFQSRMGGLFKYESFVMTAYL